MSIKIIHHSILLMNFFNDLSLEAAVAVTFICLGIYAVAGIAIAIKAMHLWQHGPHSRFWALLLFPDQTIRLKQWNHEFQKLMATPGYFEPRLPLVLSDLLGTGFDNRRGETIYIWLHVFIWPLRVLLNAMTLIWLGICAFQMNEKPTA